MAIIKLDFDPATLVSTDRDMARELADQQKQLERQEKRKAYRLAYDAARTDGRRQNLSSRSRKLGQFVGVDSEGLNIGEPTKDGKNVYQDQRTCLWKAGGVEGIPDAELRDLKGLSSRQIFDFLLSLPRQFYKFIGGVYAPIFISFGFGYDVAQMVKDLPYDKAWELAHGKPFEERNNPDYEENLFRIVLWKEYAISYIPRKSVTLFRLKDPDDPWNYKPNGERNGVKFSDRIKIYDVFGFFQQKLTAAIAEMPDVVSPDELKLIREWKDSRGKFTPEEIEWISTYTSLELKALVNMMEKLRQSLHDAIPHRPIKLKDWYGAGSIAKALLDMYLYQDSLIRTGRAIGAFRWT